MTGDADTEVVELQFKRMLARAWRFLYRPNQVWALGAQSLSSLSSLALSIFVAHSTGLTEFGVYALVWSIYWLALGATRALIGEPLLIIGQSPDGTETANARRAAWCSVTWAVGLGLLFTLVASLIGKAATPALILGLFLPGLLWQDTLRYCLFARDQARRVAMLDGLWLLLFLIAAIVQRELSLNAWIAVWGACAYISVLLGAWRYKLWPLASGSLAWLRQALPLSRALAGDFAVSTAVQQLNSFVFPLVTSLAALGAFKAGQVANGVLPVTLTVAGLLAIPAIARAHHAGDVAAVIRIGVTTAIASAAVALTYGAVLVLLPDSWGRAVLSDNWIEGSSIAPIIAIHWAVIGVNQGAMFILRSTGRATKGLRIKLALAPMNMGGFLVGAAIAGLVGATVGMVVASALGAVVWWRSALREFGHQPGDPTLPGERASSERTTQDE